MLKIDKPIIEEFLGKKELITDFVSNIKCVRLYANGKNVENMILVLTPMMKENDDKYIKQFVKVQKLFGMAVKYAEHKRGKNYVYTFESVKA